MNKQLLDCLLRQHGKKKFYEIDQSASGDMYSFDGTFMESFNAFLMGDAQSMTKSQYNNIKLFIEFADGNILTTHKDYDALVEFDKHLATIGVE